MNDSLKAHERDDGLICTPTQKQPKIVQIIVDSDVVICLVLLQSDGNLRDRYFVLQPQADRRQ